MNFQLVAHAVHVLAAGIWLGGLVFTTVVVSPAFKSMGWTPAERIAVRSAVGRQYGKVARINLLILILAAIADWSLSQFGAMALAEIGLIALIALLSELHAKVYAPRLAQAAREQNAENRARVLRISISVSMLNLALSLVVAVISSLWLS